MNLYLLGPRAVVADQFHDFDCIAGFIVAAVDERAARAAVTSCRDECRPCNGTGDEPCVWHDPTATECTLLGTAAPDVGPGVVMRDYRSGG